MKEPELESFETELRRLRPARPPGEYMDRLAAANRAMPGTGASSRKPGPVGWLAVPWIRWLAPSAAAALLLGMVALWNRPSPGDDPPVDPTPAPSASLAPADTMEFDRRLVASFDAIAELPGGEPVRFNFREWRDKVTYHDPVHNLIIERTVPRLELVPVRLETY
jgi:hypothetical protein